MAAWEPLTDWTPGSQLIRRQQPAKCRMMQLCAIVSEGALLGQGEVFMNLSSLSAVGRSAEIEGGENLTFA